MLHTSSGALSLYHRFGGGLGGEPFCAAGGLAAEGLRGGEGEEEDCRGAALAALGRPAPPPAHDQTSHHTEAAQYYT